MSARQYWCDCAQAPVFEGMCNGCDARDAAIEAECVPLKSDQEPVMKIAFIFHTEKNLGDHGAECREVILFNPDDKVSDLLAFISHRGGSLELVRQVEHAFRND